MSMQSRVPLTTISVQTLVKPSMVKSLIIGSTLGLLSAAALTGCQTTDGLSTSSAPVTMPSDKSSRTQQIPQNPMDDSTNPANPTDDEFDDSNYPILETQQDSETSSIANSNNEVSALGDSSSTPTPSTKVSSKPPSSMTPAAEAPYEENHSAANDIATSRPIITTSNAPEEVYKERPPVLDARTTQQILLEQARQNSKQSNRKPASIQDGNNLPAFQKLMNTGVDQLRQGQVSAAQATFTRAQRLGPQSSAVYFYLGQVALKQNQPLKAEAMARRGLVVAQTESRKRALWQVILKAGQAQGNNRVINEANAALSR
ncbi:hypothetical protein [Psychrobacter sp.]|uniref:hypothetical protein n=1 Tax=Psychrobacter sp. TaxID=56811 RepID=UPI0025E1A101|nr:hypothetical protein [Psychrobacter sp.]